MIGCLNRSTSFVMNFLGSRAEVSVHLTNLNLIMHLATISRSYVPSQDPMPLQFKRLGLLVAQAAGKLQALNKICMHLQEAYVQCLTKATEQQSDFDLAGVQSASGGLQAGLCRKMRQQARY